MEIEKLVQFLTVVEFGNITQAAAKLGMTQSALSKAIKRQEVSLGVSLFNHLGNRIELTSAGREYRVFAEKILLDAEMMQRRLLALDAVNRETITIAHTYPPGEPIWLHECIKDAFMQNPGMAIRLLQVDPRQIGECLRSGKASIAVSMHPYFSDDVLWKEVESEPMGIIFSENHPLSQKEKIWLKDLKSEHFFCPDLITGTSDLLRKSCERSGFIPDILFEGAHSMFVNECVWNNFGASFVSEAFYTLEKLGFDNIYIKPRLVYRRIQDNYCVRPAGIAIQRYTEMSENTQSLYRLLITYAERHNYKYYSDDNI